MRRREFLALAGLAAVAPRTALAKAEAATPAAWVAGSDLGTTWKTEFFGYRKFVFVAGWDDVNGWTYEEAA